MKDIFKFVVDSSLDELTPINSSFDKGILRICYEGKSRKRTFLSKETIEKYISTAFNCPIVANYDRELDMIGEHDVEIVRDTDGEYRLINITEPVGLVPESSKYWWELREDDGVPHEYLCMEVLVWKRQEAYRHIKDAGTVKQSMEISIDSGYLENGIFVITSFEFQAFCLIESAQPCYEGAALEMFSYDEGKANDQFKECYSQMLEDFKLHFSSASKAEEQEEGDDNMKDKEKLDLLSKFNLSVDTLDFSIDDFTVDELETKLTETTTNFSLTGQQFVDQIMESLSTVTIEREWGTVNRYCYIDYSMDNSEVYCYDIENDWMLIGMPFSLDGDRVIIDFTAAKRKKIEFVDFDEGSRDQTATFSLTIEGIEAKFKEQLVKANSNYSTLEANYSALEAKYSQLAAEKTKTEAEAVLNKFSELSGCEDFEKLKKEYATYSLNDLEEKCYAIKGRLASTTTMKFTAQPQTPSTGGIKLAVPNSVPEDEPYNGLFLKYGI